MNVYTCNEFKGHWPVGTAAVIVAKDKRQAVRLLKSELKKQGLEQKVFEKDLHPVFILAPTVIVLQDGEY